MLVCTEAGVTNANPDHRVDIVVVRDTADKAVSQWLISNSTKCNLLVIDVWHLKTS